MGHRVNGNVWNPIERLVDIDLSALDDGDGDGDEGCLVVEKKLRLRKNDQ